MNSCVMSIYGFYSTNLVLRRQETSATDKSHFCSFDAPSVYLSSFSVRRPIGFRPPSDQIPSAVRSDSVRCPMEKSKKKLALRCVLQRKHQLSIFLLLCKKLYFLFSR